MASLFFNKIGVNLFYLCIAIYLYGDLCIYFVAIPKSLQKVACHAHHNASSATPRPNVSSHQLDDVGGSLHLSDPCFGSLDWQQAYYIFVAAVAVFICPWAFFNVSKTTWLQIFTTLMRWSSFLLMIGIACAGIATRKVCANRHNDTTAGAA